MTESSFLSLKPNRPYNGVFALVSLNLLVFVLDSFLRLNFLYLNHSRPQIYQFLTSLFCHADWGHLSGNLFFLYVFGKIVEEEEGTLGVVGSYLLCGLGANIMSWIFQPGGIVSLGASGAVFGLFTVSVLLKLSLEWRKIIEAIILGQFVVSRVIFEFQNLTVQDGINRVAHLGGALIGVALILSLRRLGGESGTKN